MQCITHALHVTCTVELSNGADKIIVMAVERCSTTTPPPLPFNYGTGTLSTITWIQFQQFSENLEKWCHQSSSMATAWIIAMPKNDKLCPNEMLDLN